MKRISNFLPAQSWNKKFMMFCTSIFLALVSFAQDKKIDVDINAGKDSGGGFFASPVVWVIGVAVFILLLVALMRNNSGSRTDA
ncbi:MAG TPA: hypothetical protein VFN95_12170 [Flavitalea sp.]|nr:hypothetical protein [Flavitalea sp.]